MRATLALLLLLGACGPLVQVGGNSPRPDATYTLTAEPPVAVPAGVQPVDRARAISIDLPTVPGALQTLRVPVTISDTAIQYVQGVQWSEQPNRLFQRLLADTLVHNGIAVIDVRSSGQAGGRRLTGQLMTFGVDTRGDRMARVRYDATLAEAGNIRQRRFEREVPLNDMQADAVAAALNSAANAVANDVAKWTASAG